MSNLLQPGTYVPDEDNAERQKRERARKRMYAMYGMTCAGVGATAFAHFAAADPTGTLWAVIWTLVCLALSAWGTWSYYKRATYGYTILDGAVRMEFDTVDYYVPPHMMEPFLQGILTLFADEFTQRLGKSYTEVVGVRMIVRQERPEDPLKRIEADRVIGITYHQFKTSYVYGPYALHDGGLGYEFRLQLCEYLIPGTSEQTKIEWMKERDLL